MIAVDKNMKGQSARAIAKRKASIINLFNIPNTKEGLIQFLVLSWSNIEANKDTENVIVTKAWVGKAMQTYQLLKIQSANDPQIAGILSKYSILENKKAMEKLDGTKARRNRIILLCIAVLLLSIVPGLLYLFITDPIAKSIESGDLVNAVEMMSKVKNKARINRYFDLLLKRPETADECICHIDKNLRIREMINKDGIVYYKIIDTLIDGKWCKQREKEGNFVRELNPFIYRKLFKMKELFGSLYGYGKYGYISLFHSYSLIGNESFSETNSQYAKYDFTFDNLGRIISAVRLNSSGTPIETFSLFYDNNGSLYKQECNIDGIGLAIVYFDETETYSKVTITVPPYGDYYGEPEEEWSTATTIIGKKENGKYISYEFWDGIPDDEYNPVHRISIEETDFLEIERRRVYRFGNRGIREITLYLKNGEEIERIISLNLET